MLEHMSYFPCPDEMTIKTIILNDLNNELGYNNSAYYKKVIDTVFVQFGGMKNIGSMSGWNQGVRPKLRNMCKTYINEEQNHITKKINKVY